MPGEVLILFAHPAFQRSRVNRHLVRAVRELDGVTFHDLYEEYPDFLIDVGREQELLERHEVVVFQHPLFWYSSPAILKEWQDLVLEHGWAYGHDGRALEGKVALQAITAGGGEEAYCAGGQNAYTIRELLAPFQQTCRLCRMEYLAPFAVYGTHSITTEEDMLHHTEDYRRLIEALRDGRVDIAAAAAAGDCRINADLGRYIETRGGDA